MMNRIKYREDPIDTWAEMKRVMKKQFVLNYFYMELHHKLQTLK